MIVLIIWCILVIGCFAAARSFLSAMLLMGTAVVLLFCIVSVKKSSHTLQIKLTMPEQIKQGKKKSGKLILTDNGAFPLFCVKGTVCCRYEAADADEKTLDVKNTDASEYVDDGTDTAQQTFSCAVKSYQKEEITVKINSTRAGNVHVWLEDLTVYDMFGLFSFSADVSKIAADVAVIPATESINDGQTAQAEANKAGAEAGKTAQEEENEAGAEAGKTAQAEANKAGTEAGKTAQAKRNAGAAAKNAQRKSGAAKKKQRRRS